jgi:hypothetical protein
MAFPNFTVIAATTAIRLGRDDELLDVGCYGVCQSREEADRLCAVVREQVGRASRPVAVPSGKIGTFPNEDLWREANELPGRAK